MMVVMISGGGKEVVMRRQNGRHAGGVTPGEAPIGSSGAGGR